MRRRLRAVASAALVTGAAASGLVLVTGPAQADGTVTVLRAAPPAQDDQRVPRATALSLILLASSMHLRRWLRDNDPDGPRSD